jgi:hypothetical protein
MAQLLVQLAQQLGLWDLSPSRLLFTSSVLSLSLSGLAVVAITTYVKVGTSDTS